jgi:D-3-phosphoglycerate dehydrogenase
MEILVYAPTKSTEYLAEFGCRKIETLDELLKQADFVSVHTPLLPETEGLFDEREFSLMKSSAFFINTSRGKVVREEALYDALKNRRIRAAAVDVIENELEGQTKLRELDNVIITPHSAFLSDESLLESRERALRHLVDYLVCHRQPENRIV